MTHARVDWSEERTSDRLSDSEADSLIVKIVNRTREHPSVRRGAGVRATIALKEVARGFAAVSGVLNRCAIEKAALVTLPHRISVTPGSEKSTEDVVAAIIKEELYGQRSSKKLSLEKLRMVELSEEEVEKVLQGLLETEMNLHSEEAGWSPRDMEFALMSMRNPKVQEFFARRPEHRSQDDLELFGELVEDLEDAGLLRLTETYRYVFTERAIEELSEELRKKLERAEITREEHERASLKLNQMLDAGKKQLEVPEETVPEIVAEIMDVQDKLATPIAVDNMYVHYIVKSNKGEEVDSDRTDYRKLQVLIHNLFRKDLIEAAGAPRGFTLTGHAFTLLLDDMIKKIDRKGWNKTALIKSRADSTRVDIRRYRRSDTFRDISVQQTFKQIVKQRKMLKDVNRSDLKSFVRRPSSRVNIALCIDVSHSMGEQSKMRFAKIAAATLARKALEEGDRVGIVTFSNYGRIAMHLTDQANAIANSVFTLKASQYTNIGDAIRCARELLLRERDLNQKHIILLTDGEPTAASKGAVRNLNMNERKIIGEEYAIHEAKRTVPKGIKISVLFIASGEEMGRKFARKLTAIGGGFLCKVIAAEDLPISVLKVWEYAKSL